MKSHYGTSVATLITASCILVAFSTPSQAQSAQEHLTDDTARTAITNYLVTKASSLTLHPVTSVDQLSESLQKKVSEESANGKKSADAMVDDEFDSASVKVKVLNLRESGDSALAKVTQETQLNRTAAATLNAGGIDQYAALDEATYLFTKENGRWSLNGLAPKSNIESLRSIDSGATSLTPPSSSPIPDLVDWATDAKSAEKLRQPLPPAPDGVIESMTADAARSSKRSATAI